MYVQVLSFHVLGVAVASGGRRVVMLRSSYRSTFQCDLVFAARCYAVKHSDRLLVMSFTNGASRYLRRATSSKLQA